MVKNLPAMWETWVQFLGQEDPLEKDMAPTPVFLPGEFHGQRSQVDYSPWGHKESEMTERLHFTYIYTFIVYTHTYTHVHTQIKSFLFDNINDTLTYVKI